MAQRKPPPGGKPAAKKGTSRPAGKPGAGSTAKVSTSKAAASKAPTAKAPTAKASTAKASSAAAAGKRPPRKPGKSIVNQKQTPWGMIATVTAVVLFAAAVIIVVVVTQKSSSNDNGEPGCGNPANARYCLPALPQAMAIDGVTYKKEPHHQHVEGKITYNATPPVGGDHSGYYADCDGTVYPQPIANENAVHPLEHGAVWVTYRQGLPADQVATLAENVTGQDHVYMSPYPQLSSTVSLQAWGYQLKVSSVTDPRIAQFIAALAANPDITPELSGSESAPCTQPTFKAHPSTFGNPLSAPVAG
jgi:hypothetical protein